METKEIKVNTQHVMDNPHYYDENPEFVDVILDSNKKVLCGVQADGNVVFSAGVPKQVVDYIQQRIAELSLDEYEDIVTFLNGLEDGDKTLRQLINEKVDKVEGKSLIDEDYAESVSCEECPEFLNVIKDNEGHILFGLYSDTGKPYFPQNDMYHVISNQEWLAVWLDSSNKILFGFKRDGNTYVENKNLNDIITKIYNIGIDNIDWTALSSIEYSSNPEFVSVELDYDEHIISGRRTSDGVRVEYVGFETPAMTVGGSKFERIQDPEDRIEMSTDNSGKIVSYRKSDGTKVENVGLKTSHLELTSSGLSDLEKALKDNGFRTGTSDWSDYISNDGDNPLHLPIPELAFVNIISDFTLTNLNKKGYNIYSQEGVNYDIPTQIEYWDNQGNYFKKWTLMSGQGSSSMGYVKKNIALDFFDTEAGSDTLKIKFGDWVPQDSFHFKAFYLDYFKGISFCSYKIAEEVANTKNILENVQWKRAMYPKYSFEGNVLANEQIDDVSLQLGTEAKCQPDGFPCVIYQNDEFYGMYVLGIKKSRDNYVQKKSKPNHIHLDGQYYNANGHLFNGDLNWSAFEVRNPKNLVYATAHYDREADADTYKYDADLPGQFEIAGNSNSSSTYDNWVFGNSYAKDIIVKHTIDGKSHLFLNTIDDNSTAPIMTWDSEKEEWINGDGNPDFKNKTKCGWLNVTDTVKVKESIIKMSNRLAEIEAAGTTEAKKVLIEKYFDIESLIDYELIQCAVADVDAIWNNCQWLTWDGVKWFACEYDKDDSFGALVSCSGVRDNGGWSLSLWNTEDVDDDSPIGLVRKYYQTEAATRWQELVEKNIFTTEHFIGVITDWIKRFGNDFYKKEYKKWTDSPCARDTNINTTYWKYVKCEYQSNVAAYNSATQYSVGDRCSTIAVTPDWKHIFECVSACQGQNPTTGSLGYRGNIGQLYEFIKGNFEKENAFFENILDNN